MPSQFCSCLAPGEGDARAALRFKDYGQDAGLTNLDVYCLMQDSTGFLWMGTDNGLFRYDGRQFRAYTKVQGRRMNQKLAKRLLEDSGCTVVCAMNGREAVEAWAANRFDMVLAAGMDGYVTKPMKASELFRAIASSLESHAPAAR